MSRPPLPLALAGNLEPGLAASLRAAGTAACLSLRTSRGYMEPPPALCTTEDLRGGPCAVLFGINGFPSWGFAIGAMHAHRPHHLATYPHQLFSRGAGLVSPQVSFNAQCVGRCFYR